MSYHEARDRYLETLRRRMELQASVEKCTAALRHLNTALREATEAEAAALAELGGVWPEDELADKPTAEDKPKAEPKAKKAKRKVAERHRPNPAKKKGAKRSH